MQNQANRAPRTASPTANLISDLTAQSRIGYSLDQRFYCDDEVFDWGFHVVLSLGFFPFFPQCPTNSVGRGQLCPCASRPWVSSGPQVPAA